MTKTIVLALVLGTLISCSSNEKYENIVGEWKCTSWVNKATNTNKCRDNVQFKFLPEKQYFSKLGNAKDSGNYKIVGDVLYATPSNKLELAVKILKLNSDTLKLKMNQAGNEEILTLIRD